MPKRIPASRILTTGLSRAAARVKSDISAPFRPLGLSVGKPKVFFDGRPKLRLGDKARGTALLSGEFTYIGQTLNIGPAGDPWTVAAPSERFADWLHRFSWLEDLCVLTDKSAPVRARALVDSWISVYGDFNEFSWAPDRLSVRLYYWLSLYSPALSTDSLSEAAQTRRTIILKQMKYLRHHYNKTSPGLPRFYAALVLAMGGVRLQEKQDGYLDRGLDWLDDEIETQILADGGHISRSPEATQKALEGLMALDDLLEARGIARSKAMGRAIDRLHPILPFFTAADGGLSVFHGGSEGDAKRLGKIVKSSKIAQRPFGYCPHSGYQRLAHEGTVLMVDTGSAPPAPFDTQAHLSPLSFELSTPAGRMIVNCGWAPQQPSRWRDPMRATAAHSTLILDNRSAGRLVDSGLKARFFPGAVDIAPENVKAKRKEQTDGVWLECTHDGYRASYGLTHRRRFYMALDGQDIRGEDSLFVPLGAAPLRRDTIPFTIRFHLHPSVRATLAQDLDSAILIQGSSVGWRLRTDGGPLSIEPSLYLGYGSKPVKTQQIVISGQAFGDSDGETRSNRVRWSLKKLEARKKNGQS